MRVLSARELHYQSSYYWNTHNYKLGNKDSSQQEMFTNKSIFKKPGPIHLLLASHSLYPTPSVSVRMSPCLLCVPAAKWKLPILQKGLQGFTKTKKVTMEDWLNNCWKTSRNESLAECWLQLKKRWIHEDNASVGDDWKFKGSGEVLGKKWWSPWLFYKNFSFKKPFCESQVRNDWCHILLSYNIFPKHAGSALIHFYVLRISLIFADMIKMWLNIK